MLEAVGHEYMEEFFGCCESVLAEDGVLVLQVTKLTNRVSLLKLQFNNMISDKNDILRAPFMFSKVNGQCELIFSVGC